MGLHRFDVRARAIFSSCDLIADLASGFEVGARLACTICKHKSR